MAEVLRRGTSSKDVAGVREWRRGVSALAASCLLAMAWLVVGRLMADGAVRTYFNAVHHGLGASISVESIRPAVPPFYEATVSGYVKHPDWYDGNWYRMTVWLEPLSGTAFLISWH